MIQSTQLEAGRELPRADQSELALVSSMMYDQAARDEAIDIVTAKDFFDDRCAIMFRAIADLHGHNRPVDVITVADWLVTHDLMRAAGGSPFVSDVLHAAPSHAHAVYYAQQVAQAATLRAAIQTGTDMARDAFDNQHDPDAVLSRAEQRLSSLLDRSIRTGPERLSDVLAKTLAEIEERHSPNYEPASLSIGVGAIDAILAGGLRRKQLVILAARPGVGKTALAMQAAAECTSRGKTCLFVSLEMGGTDLVERMLCQEALVNGMELRNGTLSLDCRRRVIACAAESSQRPLFVEERASITFREIAASARKLKRKQGLDLIAIDYLQLMEPIDKKVQREQQVAQISRGLKLLAKDLDVPVLCLCQINREVEKQNREPRLSDLRESGAIEQDADAVVFLHASDNGAVNDDGSTEVKAIVAKQRSGPRAEVVVLWHKRYTKFVEKAAARFKEFDGFNGADPLAD